jgi:hypothetical protein
MNETPAGYKRTEVGVIPEDWEVKALCAVAEIRSGIAKNSNISVSDPVLVHYLRVANVQDGFLDLSEMNQIAVSHRDLQRFAVLPGDVLLNEGGDLIDKLGRTEESLICSLVHKFGGRGGKGERDEGAKEFIKALRTLPPGFQARGDLHVFVDECHRTQSGDLHEAMKAVLPNALFIGFTGTPLLAADKKRSIEVFGRYIHTYKFDQAVREGVVLDLRYEARDIDQAITSQKKIDDWFEAKTKGLNDLAKAQLKQKWGTMQRVLSSQSRLEKIVADILLDMNTKARLMDGHGNAMLVAGSIYEACKFYELFADTELKGRCAIVSSYAPATSDTKGESTGEGETDNLFKYAVYRQMLADWCGEPPETAVGKVEKFEKEVKKKFVDEPGQMKLLIVVDKLLTGFDAPSATYLYIDKQMRDHGLFQAICRVNRLDGESKDYAARTTATSSTTRTCSRAWKARCATTPAARSTPTTRTTCRACSRTGSPRRGRTWKRRGRRCGRCASWWSRRGIPPLTSTSSARKTPATRSNSRRTSRAG